MPATVRSSVVEDLKAVEREHDATCQFGPSFATAGLLHGLSGKGCFVHIGTPAGIEGEIRHIPQGSSGSLAACRSFEGLRVS